MGWSGMDFRALMNAQFTVYMHMDDFTICLLYSRSGDMRRPNKIRSFIFTKSSVASQKLKTFYSNLPIGG